MSPDRARREPIDPYSRYLLIRRWIALAYRAREIEALTTPKVVVALVGLISLKDAFDNRYLDNRTVTANADAERFAAVCRALLPDATVIVHGSLALGDFRQGESDLDLLVLSDASMHGLAEALEEEWSRDPVKFDLRVVSYAAAAQPTKRPRARLCVDGHGANALEVEEDKLEPDLLIDFSVCRQMGEGKLIGPVPPEWVDEVGETVIDRWKRIGYDPPNQEFIALTACRIWRFREERLHCSKPAAAAWAHARGARVAYDEASVKSLLDRASA